MHRANVVIGSGGGRRSTVQVVDESDATASSTYVGGVDGHDDDFAVDDGVDEASTTTMIYVKKECSTMDEGDDSNHLLSLQQQHDGNDIEDVSILILHTQV